MGGGVEEGEKKKKKKKDRAGGVGGGAVCMPGQNMLINLEALFKNQPSEVLVSLRPSRAEGVLS